MRYMIVEADMACFQMESPLSSQIIQKLRAGKAKAFYFDDGQYHACTSIESTTPITRIITAEDCMDGLRGIMREDPSYAHSWHCNVAMAGCDRGLSHEAANAMATNFMKLAFDVETSNDMLSGESLQPEEPLPTGMG